MDRLVGWLVVPDRVFVTQHPSLPDFYLLEEVISPGFGIKEREFSARRAGPAASRGLTRFLVAGPRPPGDVGGFAPEMCDAGFRSRREECVCLERSQDRWVVGGTFAVRASCTACGDRVWDPWIATAFGFPICGVGVALPRRA